jgi:hypothetical protein
VNLQIEFHDIADVDLFEAWSWYEDQQDGLGDGFLRSVEATVHRAARWPNGGEPVVRDDDGDIIERKTATNGFPYAVRYRVMGDRLVVMAGATPTPTPRRRFRPRAVTARTSGASGRSRQQQLHGPSCGLPDAFVLRRHGDRTLSPVPVSRCMSAFR